MFSRYVVILVQSYCWFNLSVKEVEVRLQISELFSFKLYQRRKSKPINPKKKKKKPTKNLYIKKIKKRKKRIQDKSKSK